MAPKVNKSSHTDVVIVVGRLNYSLIWEHEFRLVNDTY